MNDLMYFLINHLSTEVGFCYISDITPKKGLNVGVVFFITYPKEVI